MSADQGHDFNDNNQLDILLFDEPQAVRDWVNAGITLTHGISDHQWAIADWMLWGERHFSDISVAYDYAERATGFSRKTLREWAYVARHVSMRMDALSFGHHQVVAALMPEAQKRCLELAASEQMPIGDLKRIAQWQPRIVELDRKEEQWWTQIPLRAQERELALLQIAAQQQGFRDDDGNSAIGHLIRKIFTDYLEANPAQKKAAAEEYIAAQEAGCVP